MANTDDLGRPSRRQASSSRRSSTQRTKPRTRSSNQSLYSAGRPQENTTFTSFEPFSPPNTITSNPRGSFSGNGVVNGNGNGNGNGTANGAGNGNGNRGRDDVSVRSYSSSKRSRSIFAPNRANSVVEDDEHERLSQSAASGGEVEGETEQEAASGSEPDTRPMSQVSVASQSLINAVLNMAPPQDDNRPPLFADMNNPFNNPAALAEATDQTVATIVKRQGGAGKVIRRLAKDLADRDAEVARLRKRLEEFGSLYKDHLMSSHNLSRLDADRTVRTMSPNAPEVDNVQTELESAASDPFSEHHEVGASNSALVLPTDSLKPLHPTSTPASPGWMSPSFQPFASASTSASARNTIKAKSQETNVPKVRSGLFSLFGGGGGSVALRQNKNPNRASIASMLDPRNRVPNTDRSRSTSMSSYQPLEMEQKIENEHLPPPLLEMKIIKIIYREFISDNYGFIIDASRVTQWLLGTDEDRTIVSSKGKGRTSSIATNASSVASADDGQADSEVHEESRPWHEYLTLEVTKQALLSRLPIQLQGHKSTDRSSISSDEDSTEPRLEDVIDPADFTTHAEHLRDEISAEYTSLQYSRNQAYDRLMIKVEEKPTSNRLSRIFSNNIETPPRNRVESLGSGTVGIANLATSGVGVPFMRFVLDGIPMNKRAKIWLESAQSSIHYSPEDFSILKVQFKSDPDQKYLHDIRMDAPRTLTNNVYFRKDRNQDSLATLLGCFALRNPHIGYCQGFNIIAGYLLLSMPTTEQAFWVFCFLIEEVLPQAYFTAEYDWQGPRADTIVLRQYIRSLMPRLAAHLDALDIADEQTVPINWFLTAFASTLSVEALFRVWDVVLGIPGQQVFLIHVAIALLKLNEEELLKVESQAGLYDYMDRKMAKGVVTIDGLIQASSRLGPIVTARSVEKRRKEATSSLL